MNTKKFSDAMSELDIKYVDEAINYKKKVKRPAWLKWGAMAACLCIAVCVLVFPIMQTEQPHENIAAPHVVIANTTYIISPHNIIFEACPTDFEYSGTVDSDIEKGCSYYTNPEVPEWIYIEQEVPHTGTANEYYIGYVRYVAEDIRGKDFINYNDNIYVSLYHAQYPIDISKSLYDEVKDTYGLRIEGANIDGFSFVGTTVFEGFDVVPNNNLGSNSHQQEEKIYANNDDENVILISTKWNTSSGVHYGFLVYVKSNFEYEAHKDTEVFEYNGRYFSQADLSTRTVEWLEWYNLLSEKEKLAVSYEPAELVDTSPNAEVIETE